MSFSIVYLIVLQNVFLSNRCWWKEGTTCVTSGTFDLPQYICSNLVLNGVVVSLFFYVLSAVKIVIIVK